MITRQELKEALAEAFVAGYEHCHGDEVEEGTGEQEYVEDGFEQWWAEL